MNPELVVAGLLNHATITALVGDGIALEQLPQGTDFPAIVYRIVSTVPVVNVNHTDKPRMRIRVQINPIASTIQGVKDVHAAVRAVIDFRHNTEVAGTTIMTCRFDSLGPIDRDEEAGIWTQPADYLLTYEE